MRFSIIYCILFILSNQSEGFLFTKLKQKLRAFLKGKTQNQIAEFPSESGLEYPGNDPQLRWEIRQLWKEYYACLEKKYISLGPHKSVMPEAIMVFEGSSVRLDCKVCVSPAEINTIDDVTWYYTTIPPNGDILLEYGEHVLLSPEDKILHMYNLQQENSGQYLCKVGHTVMASYFLEVVNDSEPTVKGFNSSEWGPSNGLRKNDLFVHCDYGWLVSNAMHLAMKSLAFSTDVAEVRPHTALNAIHSFPPEDVPGHNFKVLTLWETWSPCSKCGEVGKKVRFGICIVKILQDDDLEINALNATDKLTDENKYFETTSNISQNLSSHHTKRRTFQMAEKEAIQILTLFKKGVPCRSSLLPSELKSIPQIHARKSEVMIAFCKESCPGSSVFEVLDEKGKVVETANNSAGIYSTLQGIPPIPPSVERRTIYEDTNTYKIIIKCPGNLNTDTPVQWKIGNMNINPILIEKQSGGRMYVDIKDHINLKRPQPPDSNVYSCWQGKELAGTVRLVITKTVRLNFNHHIMLLGIVIITGTFVIVCFRAFKGRKRLLV